MILIDKNTTKQCLLDDLIKHSKKSGRLILLIESLPIFLSTPITFSNFIFTIDSYPRRVIFSTNDPEVLIFLRENGADVSISTVNNNALSVKPDNVIVKPSKSFLDLTVDFSNESRLKFVENNFPLLDVSKNKVVYTSPSIWSKVKSLSPYYSTQEVDLDKMLDKIAGIKYQIKSDYDISNTAKTSFNKKYLLSAISIAILFCLVFIIIISLFPYNLKVNVQTNSKFANNNSLYISEKALHYGNFYIKKEFTSIDKAVISTGDYSNLVKQKNLYITSTINKFKKDNPEKLISNEWISLNDLNSKKEKTPQNISILLSGQISYKYLLSQDISNLQGFKIDKKSISKLALNNIIKGSNSDYSIEFNNLNDVNKQFLKSSLEKYLEINSVFSMKENFLAIDSYNSSKTGIKLPWRDPIIKVNIN